MWGFCQRLRRIASEEMVGQPASPWCRSSIRLCSEPSRWALGPVTLTCWARPEAEKLLPGSLEALRRLFGAVSEPFQEPPAFEEELFRSRQPKVSPEISVRQVERCLRGEPEAEESPKNRCLEFELDSVYHVALPSFQVLLDFQQMQQAVLDCSLPHFEVIYGSQLDCRRGPFEPLLKAVCKAFRGLSGCERRFLSVSSSCGRFVEAQYGAQSCAEAFRGALKPRRPRERADVTT